MTISRPLTASDTQLSDARDRQKRIGFCETQHSRLRLRLRARAVSGAKNVFAIGKQIKFGLRVNPMLRH